LAQEQYFKGDELHETELVRRRNYPWEEILGAIGPGKAREVVMAQYTVRTAIAELVKSAKIRKNEFYVVTKGVTGARRRVFIVHRALKWLEKEL
jgi:hypothetical protein